ncbi:Short integuments 2, mitochondrial [Linum perenne]
MGRGLKVVQNKGLGQMLFNTVGGVVNWFPGHMAAATRAIRQRLKVSDLVIEVRDSRKWVGYFDSCKQDSIFINSHSKNSVQKLLELVEFKLKEVISREPTLLVMVVGVPNVGKSALINSIRQIALSRFPVGDKIKRATVGPLPGVTQDIAGYKIAHQPSIYVLDTPGVLIPSIPDIETGLKLALAGSVKDSAVGEERIAQYLLAVLNIRGTPLHWKHWNNRKMDGIKYETEDNRSYSLKDLRQKKRNQPNFSDLIYIDDIVTEVQCALYRTLTEFEGNVEEENGLENLIEEQFVALQKAMKIPHKASEARLMVSKKLLTLFRTGKLGPFILDDVPDY